MGFGFHERFPKFFRAYLGGQRLKHEVYSREQPGGTCGLFLVDFPASHFFSVFFFFGGGGKVL